MSRMPKEITLADTKELLRKFEDYTKNAEQHEFFFLLITNGMLLNTIAHYEELGYVDDQRNARAMFRSIYRIIGLDYSDYEEEITE